MQSGKYYGQRVNNPSMVAVPVLSKTFSKSRIKILMGDPKALFDTNSKENTAKREVGMTLLICFVYSDTNDGRGKKILLLP